MSLVEETFQSYKMAQTVVLLRFGTMKAAVEAVLADKSITESMSEEEREIIAFEMVNLRRYFDNDPAAVLTAIRARGDSRKKNSSTRVELC